MGIFDIISKILSEYPENLSENKNNEKSVITEINNQYNNLEDCTNNTKVISVGNNEKENNENWNVKKYEKRIVVKFYNNLSNWDINFCN